MHLGILASHPVQYQAPWFRALAQQVDLEVFFAHRQTPKGQADGGFGVAFDWDVDLLSGYKHRFLNNVARRPGVNHFLGCDTPEVANIIRRAESRKQKVERGLQTTDYATTGLRDHSPISDLPSTKRFDAFIASGWQLKCYWQAVRACRRARVPVLVRGDSQLRTPRSPLKRLVKEVLYRFLLRQFDGFLVVGQRNREYLGHYGVKEERMFFAPHFVDNEWFKGNAEKLKPERAEIRKRWGIAEDAFCVLFCGKFIPKKRPLDLVAAVRFLSSSISHLPSPISHLRSSISARPAIHLLFVGSGELGGQLRNSCYVVFDAEEGERRGQRAEGRGQRSEVRGQKSEVRDQRSVVRDQKSEVRDQKSEVRDQKSEVSGPAVSSPLLPSSISPLPDFSVSAFQDVSISADLPSATFAGFLNQGEISKAYVAADCLVLPSDGGETWGLVVNEGMACGLPAVVSDAVGCAPDLIDEGRTGFTFPVGDTAQLANRLAVLLGMKQRGHDFRPALAEKMGTYSVESAVNGTLKAVENSSRGGRASPRALTSAASE